MKFNEYFGIKPSEVKETCIICQSFDLPLFSDKVSNGFFVKTAELPNATVIALKNNFLAGDSVLYLKETKCKTILLFGSCGGCGNVESGDLVMINKAYNFESFSKMLSLDKTPDYYKACEKTLRSFYSQNLYSDLIKTDSACVSSLLLEPDYIGFFKENNICAVDMESSIVFSAAQSCSIKPACFMYVADHIENNPVGKSLNEKTKKKISSARKCLASMIKRFVQ